MTAFFNLHGSLDERTSNHALFILYINDMCHIYNLVKSILFTENTNMFQANSNISRHNETLCSAMERLCVWFAVSKLTRNINKTNYMLF